MKSLTTAVLLLLSCSVAFAQGYTPYYSDTFSTINSANWYSNGSVSGGSSGLYGTSGSLISKLAAPSPGNSYEVKMTLNLNSSGGYYMAFLRATSDALPTGAGTAYIAELANVQVSGSACSGQLYIWKMIAGAFTMLASTSAPCHNGTTVRAVMTASNAILLYVDNVLYTWAADSAITSGQPGVAVYNVGSGSFNSNSISRVDLGPLDQTPPNAIAPASVGSSAFPNHVDFQWQGVSDNAGGTGVAYYQVTRNGVWFTSLPGTVVTDATVTAGTTYTYTIQAVDFHWNTSAVTFVVVTPPAGAIDPRQVGVRSTGSYWGGGGENIDMRSGNLNFTIPLLKVKGRGWNLPFNLSYNSQNWRQDGGGIWNLGRDGGFGYGWKLQAGALMPVYSGYFTIDHYLFIDSTGAEYRLDVNNGGVWTSRESIYPELDTTSGILYFPDGTKWAFACTSGGTEQDSGVGYPTVIQDSNGNQATITYQAGLGLTGNNSSSRISLIQDVMGSYNFTYNQDSIPHLTTITSSYPGERYTLAYTANASLVMPFTGGPSGINAQMLQTVTNTDSSMTTRFDYGSMNSGELNQVTFPYGGHLRWAYNSVTYSNARTQREVPTRYLAMSSGATELVYGISHPGDTGTSFHSKTELDDAAGIGSKVWTFDLNSDAGFGLQNQFEERHSGVTKSQTNATWTSDVLSRPYIATTLTTLDGSTQKRTDQVLDQYGNMTSMSLYDFGATTPTRTYSNTYLSDSTPSYSPDFGGWQIHPDTSTYNAQRIRNRLIKSTVTQGGLTTVLVRHSYDSYDPGQCGANRTPTGWDWVNSVGSIDPANTTNVFRGNVTTRFGLDMTHKLCYGTTGAVVMTIDGGHTTTTQTSSQTNYTAPNTITTGSLTTSLNWTSSLGLANETGPNGDYMGIGYDGAARPLSTTSPYGATTTFAYSINPPTTTATTRSNQTPALPSDNRWTRTTMDGFGRTIKTEAADSAGAVQSVTDVQYAACGCSPLGKMSQKSMPHTPTGTVYWTVYSYDGLGRTTSVLAPDGASRTTYSYAGNTVTVTDPAGKWKTFTMDAFGNLTKVVEPDSSQTNTNSQATTTYTYDALNHLIGVSMPRQMPGGNIVTQVRTFAYSSGGGAPGAYLLSATNPENGTVTYSYNADGTMASKTDAKGQTLLYLRDSYGRVTQVQHTNPNDFNGNPVPPTTIRTYTYDSNPIDSTYSQFASGRLTTIQYNVSGAWWNTYTDYVNGAQVQFTGDNVVEMYTYNRPGKLTGKRLRVTRTTTDGNVTAPDLNATWTYNNEGNLTGVSYPGDPNATANPAATYSYSYDGMDRLTGMTETAPSSFTLLSGVTYNAAGQMTQMGSETRTYNAMGQLTNITVPGSMNITYNYSPTQNNGKITSQVDSLTGEQVTYAYDSLNRLISAQAGTSWGQGFVYDPFGNLTDKNVLAGSAPPLHVVINAANNHAGGEDLNGNAGGMTWDTENRLTSVPEVAQTINVHYSLSYAYDGQNKRMWANTPTVDQISGNVSDSEHYSFYGADGRLMAQFTPVYSPRMVGSPASLTWQNGPTRVYFGSRLLGNEDRVGSRGKYFPYGEERGSQNPPNDNVKFATYTRDAATGLDYANQRYYNSTYGRFLTPDPYRKSGQVASPQSWNRYVYVHGDPLNYYDPNGLCAVMLAGITMSPDDTQPFGRLASDLGSDQAYPYAHLNTVQSVVSVVSQAIFGPNTSTDQAFNIIEHALGTNSGSIDVIAYSGGAQAFATALGLLSQADRNRIGSILYISPGVVGTLPTTRDISKTTVVIGTETADVLATIAVDIPTGVNITRTACSHTDIGCLLAAAATQIAAIRAGGPCRSPITFSLPPPGIAGGGGSYSDPVDPGDNGPYGPVEEVGPFGLGELPVNPMPD